MLQCDMCFLNYLRYNTQYILLKRFSHCENNNNHYLNFFINHVRLLGHRMSNQALKITNHGLANALLFISSHQQVGVFDLHILPIFLYAGSLSVHLFSYNILHFLTYMINIKFLGILARLCSFALFDDYFLNKLPISRPENKQI